MSLFFVENLLKEIHSADKALWEKLVNFKETYGIGRLESFFSMIYKSKDDPIIETIREAYDEWRSTAAKDSGGGDQFQKYLITITGINNLPVSSISRKRRHRHRRRTINK